MSNIYRDAANEANRRIEEINQGQDTLGDEEYDHRTVLEQVRDEATIRANQEEVFYFEANQ